MASQRAETSAREIAFDRLPEAGASLEVLLLDNVTFHADDECGPFRQHRHDYHELIWTREGAAEHPIDGEVSLVEPNEITSIGRSQVMCSSAPVVSAVPCCGSAKSCCTVMRSRARTPRGWPADHFPDER